MLPGKRTLELTDGLNTVIQKSNLRLPGCHDVCFLNINTIDNCLGLEHLITHFDWSAFFIISLWSGKEKRSVVAFSRLIWGRWGAGWRAIFANLWKYAKKKKKVQLFCMECNFLSRTRRCCFPPLPPSCVHQNKLTCKEQRGLVSDDDVVLFYCMSFLVYYGMFQRTLSAQQRGRMGIVKSQWLLGL